MPLAAPNSAGGLSTVSRAHGREAPHDQVDATKKCRSSIATGICCCPQLCAEPSPQKRLTRRTAPSAQLFAPAQLHFGDDHDGVAEFANGIRILMAGNHPLYLDFTKVEEAGPAAALHIAAEIDRWRHYRQAWTKPRVYDFDRWQPSIRRYFLDLGLFELLNVSNGPTDLPQVSRQHVENAAQSYDCACRRHPAPRRSACPMRVRANRLAFFDALSEAMSNVMHHAYQDPDPNGWPTLPKSLVDDCRFRPRFCRSANCLPGPRCRHSEPTST